MKKWAGKIATAAALAGTLGTASAAFADTAAPDIQGIGNCIAQKAAFNGHADGTKYASIGSDTTFDAETGSISNVRLTISDKKISMEGLKGESVEVNLKQKGGVTEAYFYYEDTTGVDTIQYSAALGFDKSGNQVSNWADPQISDHALDKIREIAPNVRDCFKGPGL